MNLPLPTLQQYESYWAGRFQAMASPCELLIETDDQQEAADLTRFAANEAWRIEQKFSRYRDDNIIYRINTSHGKTIEVDDETAKLLDFANNCYQISGGLFDITSGVLRRCWKFDGSDNIPKQRTIKKNLTHVGWNKVTWQAPFFTLPKGMEIDLGGIGKEYAVDRTVGLLNQQTQNSLLLNFGGDLHANKPRKHHHAWITGIENPNHTEQASQHIELVQGALATSGDARRYLQKDGKRYSHILNPKTGWPVENPPRSVTVHAPTCTEAGILSTLASLYGSEAEIFLQNQAVKFWCLR